MFYFLISFFFFNIWSRVKYNKTFNPILVFSFIFFFHNISYYILRELDFPVFWIAPLNLDDYTLDFVFEINLWCYVAFCLTFLIFAKSRNTQYQFSLSPSMNKRLKLFYNLFTVLSLIYITIESIGVYGSAQSANSQMAFNPLKRLIDFRFYLAVFMIINSKEDKKFKYLIVEIIMSVIGGGRKALVIVFCTYILTQNLKLRFKVVVRYAMIILPMIYILLFINITRGLSKKNSISDKISYTNEYIKENSSFVIGKLITSSNSEGVQNWTYQLVEKEWMDLSLGKSYAHAIINIFVLRVFQGDIADWQAAYKFKYVAYPNTNNQGWDYSFTSEAIMNWGDWAFLSYVFLAMTLALFYNRRNKSLFFRTLYFSAFPFLMIYFRTDSTSLLRAFSYVIFISVIVRFYSFKKVNI